MNSRASLARRRLQKLKIRVARSVTLVDGKFVVGAPKSSHGRTVSLPEFVAGLLQPGGGHCAGVP